MIKYVYEIDYPLGEKRKYSAYSWQQSFPRVVASTGTSESPGRAFNSETCRIIGIYPQTASAGDTGVRSRPAAAAGGTIRIWSTLESGVSAHYLPEDEGSRSATC